MKSEQKGIFEPEASFVLLALISNWARVIILFSLSFCSNKKRERNKKKEKRIQVSLCYLLQISSCHSDKMISTSGSIHFAIFL